MIFTLYYWACIHFSIFKQRPDVSLRTNHTSDENNVVIACGGEVEIEVAVGVKAVHLGHQLIASVAEKWVLG